MSELRPLLGFAAPYRLRLASGAFLMLGESGAALAVPWIAGLLAASMLGGRAPLEVSTALAILVALFAAQALLKFASVYLLDGVADRIVADLRIRLYDHLQALPLAFYHRHRLGDTLALIASDAYVVGGYIGGTAMSAVPLAITAAGAALLMLKIRAEFAVVVLLLVPLFYLAMKIAGRRLRPLAVELQDAEAHAFAIAHENLDMLPAIKTFTRETQESARFRAQLDRILHLSARQRLMLAAFGPLMQFLAAAGLLLLLALAGADLIQGRLEAGELVAFVLYAQLLSRPVAGLADVYGATQTVRGALARLYRAMSEPVERLARAGIAMPHVRGEIQFRGVTFGYEDRPSALECLDLRIAARETVAIVGPNGAGKSTVAHLLVRLHAPSAGSILIDGIDIAGVSLESLRGQIGIVPQHVLLFNASVRDNIAYGRPEPRQAQVEVAARAAGAHDFISKLPQGYETVVGDRGVRLSGGQQQRVALARALLKDPPILILDEATAMFDPQGEEDFLESCRGALSARTVLMITHRQASLRSADRIVHLRNGRIERIEARAERAPRRVAGA